MKYLKTIGVYPVNCRATWRQLCFTV